MTFSPQSGAHNAKRDNAADQYAADATIKIKVLREYFRHENAQMAKVNPRKFQSNLPEEVPRLCRGGS